MSGALALIGFGLSVTGNNVLPTWTGWVAVAFGGFILALFAATRDVPPFLPYTAPLVFGLTALIRAAATANTPG